MSKGRVSLDDIVRKVADTQDLSLSLVKAVLDNTFCVTKDSVAAGYQVSITKFGVFMPVRAKAYVARNPKTGEPVSVPAKDRVRFRPFDDFKKKVDG